MSSVNYPKMIHCRRHIVLAEGGGERRRDGIRWVGEMELVGGNRVWRGRRDYSEC